jgi:hypothetical protein
MIQKITIEECKFLEMSYYQRDSQTGHDSRDNNRSTESRHNQERQAVNASTNGARGNNFGGRILNFFARRKKINVTCIYVENV